MMKRRKAKKETELWENVGRGNIQKFIVIDDVLCCSDS